MSRIDQVNELLKGELANLVNQEVELENGLITIVYVDASPDLKTAKIGISVLPENLSGTALKKLRALTGRLTKTLGKKLKIRKIPKLIWEIDQAGKEARVIEELLNEIKEEK